MSWAGIVARDSVIFSIDCLPCSATPDAPHAASQARGPLRSVADSARDLVLVVAHHPVAAGIVGVELPAERIGVKALKRLSVLARDLEMNDVTSHDEPPKRA